jgi:hypothetical protein
LLLLLAQGFGGVVEVLSRRSGVLGSRTFKKKRVPIPGYAESSWRKGRSRRERAKIIEVPVAAVVIYHSKALLTLQLCVK